MPDVLIHHPQAAWIVPPEPFLQQLALRHHLAGPTGEVDQEGVLTVGERQRALGQEHAVVVQVNLKIAESQDERDGHLLHRDRL